MAKLVPAFRHEVVSSITNGRGACCRKKTQKDKAPEDLAGWKWEKNALVKIANKFRVKNVPSYGSSSARKNGFQ